MAIITVGAESEFEKSYLKLKVEDTVNAVQNSLSEGVVRGGGISLKQIAEEMPDGLLTGALKAPYNQIQENGITEIGENIIDPVITTISAVKVACSIAGRVITTEVVTAVKTEKDES